MKTVRTCHINTLSLQTVLQSDAIASILNSEVYVRSGTKFCYREGHGVSSLAWDPGAARPTVGNGKSDSGMAETRGVEASG